MRRNTQATEKRSDVGVGDVGLRVGDSFIVQSHTSFDCIRRPRFGRAWLNVSRSREGMDERLYIPGRFDRMSKKCTGVSSAMASVI